METEVSGSVLRRAGRMVTLLALRTPAAPPPATAEPSSRDLTPNVAAKAQLPAELRDATDEPIRASAPVVGDSSSTAFEADAPTRAPADPRVRQWAQMTSPSARFDVFALDLDTWQVGRLAEILERRCGLSDAAARWLAEGAQHEPFLQAAPIPLLADIEVLLNPEGIELWLEPSLSPRRTTVLLVHPGDSPVRLAPVLGEGLGELMVELVASQHPVRVSPWLDWVDAALLGAELRARGATTSFDPPYSA